MISVDNLSAIAESTRTTISKCRTFRDGVNGRETHSVGCERSSP